MNKMLIEINNKQESVKERDERSREIKVASY
jgi:hypothetical protein